VINLCSQSTNGSILKNLCQAKQDKHMNKKIMTIPLVQHLWLANNQVRIDQVLLLSIKYLCKQLDHKNKVFKNESMKDMK
jgi:abortive infection bacteriophage resistance protein